MAVKLTTVTEVYEVDSENEMDELLAQQREKYNVKDFSSKYKESKKDDYGYFIVKITKEFDD